MTPLVVTMGEAMLRLTPPGAGLIATATGFSVFPGGAEANVAAGVSGLGLRTRWFSRVADGPPGDLVMHGLASHGVDTSHVIRAPGRTGIYYMEEGDGPRPARVVYDRSGSAFSHITMAAAERALAGGLLQDSAVFMTSGISLALGPSAEAAVRTVWDAAHGMLRVFDLNFRASLGTKEEAVSRARDYLANCDVLFAAERDVSLLYGDADLRSLAPDAVIVLTQGANGATARLRDGSELRVEALPTGQLGRIGRGDAFVAGFLASWLQERGDAEAALRQGVAAASYKSSVAGDLARLDPAAVRELAAGAAGGDVRR